jgi:hypothetical protein
MTLYGERDFTVRPVLPIAMPRLPRIYSLGATMHVVARCNNRKFYFAAPEESEIDGRASVPSATPFLKRHHPPGRRRGIIPLPEQIRKV